MKKQMAVLLTGMILMTQSICGAVYGAELIEKEPVKVTGDSVHAPDVETKVDKEPIGIARGEETKEVVLETAETENAEMVPKLEGKDIEFAMELVENEDIGAYVWYGETEDSEDSAKRKEAVQNVAEDVEDMPESLEIDGKTLTACKREGMFGFYYDAERYDLKENETAADEFFYEIASKDGSRKQIWIVGYGKTVDTEVKESRFGDIPLIGSGKVGAYGMPAFMSGYFAQDSRVTDYSISTEKGYIMISVWADSTGKWEEAMQILDTLIIDGVNWEKEDISEMLKLSGVQTEEEIELREENAEINAETK